MAGRIAVIEDDSPTRDFVVRALEGAGFTVDAAARGAEGVALVERGHPDLVLLDLMMPGVTGYEVCERIRKGPASHTQIVVMSVLEGWTRRSKSSSSARTITWSNRWQPPSCSPG